MLNIFKKIAVMLAVVSFSSGLMAAPFVIDDFTVTQSMEIADADPDLTESVFGATSSLIGGARTTTLSAPADGVDYAQPLRVNTGGVNDQLLISNGYGVKGTITLLWDNNGAGMDEDLTVSGSLTHLFLDVLGIDLTTTVQFTMTDTAASGGDSHTTDAASFSGSGLFTSSFDEFVADGVDMEHIASIEMILTGARDWDAGFASLYADNPNPPVVPEPESIALVFLGLLGLAYGRRKVK